MTRPCHHLLLLAFLLVSSAASFSVFCFFAISYLYCSFNERQDQIRKKNKWQHIVATYSQYKNGVIRFKVNITELRDTKNIFLICLQYFFYCVYL